MSKDRALSLNKWVELTQKVIDKEEDNKLITQEITSMVIKLFVEAFSKKLTNEGVAGIQNMYTISIKEKKRRVFFCPKNGKLYNNNENITLKATYSKNLLKKVRETKKSLDIK